MPCLKPGHKQEPVFDGDYSFNVGYVTKFNNLDYSIVIVSLILSTVIGIYVAWDKRDRNSITEFVLAGRTISALPAGMSLAGSYVSGITMLSVPGVVYSSSTLNAWMSVAFVTGVYSGATIFMPLFYRLKLTSVYEYLELRFNRRVRLLGSIYFTIMMVTYTGLVLYAPSFAFQKVTGVNMFNSMLFVGILCIFYTAMGGMRAVIYTDVFQVVLMFIGLVVFAATANWTVGWSDMFQSVMRTNRLVLYDFQLDLTKQTVWSLALGGYLYQTAMFGVNQQMMHRCLCCKTESEAYRAMMMSAGMLCAILYTCVIIGMFMSAFYENCDPARVGIVGYSDEYAALFLMDIAKHGIPGIYMAAVFSATLSSFSSGLNSIATVALEDWFRPVFKKRLREGFSRFIIQIITVVIGVAALETTTLFASDLPVWKIDVALSGGLLSPLLGVTILGLAVPWTNETGAFYGMIIGTVLNVGIMFFKHGFKLEQESNIKACISNCNTSLVPKNFYYTSNVTTKGDTDQEFSFADINSWYDIGISCIFTIVAGILVSYITGFNDPKEIDPVLIVAVFDDHFPFYYLPKSIRERLRFGIDHEGKWEKWQLKKEAEQEKMEEEMKEEASKEMELLANSRDIYSPNVEQTFRGTFKKGSISSSSLESEI